MYSKLQYISQGNSHTEQLKSIQNALDAGCDWIQLRYKDKCEEEVLRLAQEVKKMCKSYEATFIVNDFIEIAKFVDADGVHLGLNDSAVEKARLLLGNHKIIGGTANILDDVLLRISEKCDYVGLGPFRYTATKATLSPILGIEGYSKVVRELEKRDLSIPIYAIGGILTEDMEDILQTGIYGVAVSGLISNSVDPKQTVEQIKNVLYVIS